MPGRHLAPEVSIVPTIGAPGVPLVCSGENVTFCVWIILHLLEVCREIFTCAYTFKNPHSVTKVLIGTWVSQLSLLS